MTVHLFDTHAHLSYEPLANMAENVVSEATAAGVTRITAIGTDLRSSLQCIQLAERFDGVFASVGIHPNGCHQATIGQWREIEALLTHPKVVALGETGIDCYWDDSPISIQQHWFATHIHKSHESGKPLVVHLRDSENEILSSFEQHHDGGRINGIMHSFTGKWSTAERCLDYGMYISFAGMLTFKNAQAVRDVAAKIPVDRLLVETDAPYLTPAPHRGKKPNQPKMVVHTAECLATVLGLTLDDVAAVTTENAMRVFGLTGPIDADSPSPK